MIKHLRYLYYVLKHKRHVFVAGLKLGVPIWRLILHDWTKFLPCEWSPYVEFFYGGAATKSEWVKQWTSREFDRAWNHHQKRNDHHWQYYLLHFDDGGSRILDMPDVCRREMLADWRGAGKAVGKPDTSVWYEANKDKMQLHPETRLWIETKLKEQQELDRLDRAFRAGLFG